MPELLGRGVEHELDDLVAEFAGDLQETRRHCRCELKGQPKEQEAAIYNSY